MKRTTFVAVLVLGFIAVLAFAAVAAAVPTPPYATNASCLECHDLALGGPAITKVDFSAPPVDLARCVRCHGEPPHQPSAGECNECHPSWPDRPVFYSSAYLTAYGYFDNADSLNTGPDELHAIHVNGSWFKDLTTDPTCAVCHVDVACGACHAGGAGHKLHAVDPVTGQNEYPSVEHLVTNGARVFPKVDPCLNDACHDLANAGTPAFSPPCGRCHPTRVDAHGYESADHAADVGADVGPGGKPCGSCHAMDVLSEHERATSASAGGQCGTCHPTPRDSLGTWDDTCQTGGCHAAAGPTEPHLAQAAAHAPAFAGDSAICADCHEPDLEDIHAAAASSADPALTSCNVCHSTTEYPATDDCATCHAVFDGHLYDTAAHTSSWALSGCVAAGCHGSNELWAEHTRARPTFACATCHDNDADPSYGAAIAVGETGCGSCHAGITESSSHRTQHPAVPPLVDATGTPSYAYYEGAAGGTPTTDCALCHASNLIDEHLGDGARPARTDSAGSPLDCGACHDTTDPRVVGAIATGLTNCDACHDVHGPIAAAHASDYVDSPAVPCADCHDSNLTVLHDGVEASPNGRLLTGCELCHAYTDGARGQQIQYAIEVANETSCDACHTGFHADTGAAHSATTTDSVGPDGCGDCHEGAVGGEISVTQIHAGITDPGPCAVCHDNGARVADITTLTPECASCHSAEGTDYHRNMGVHTSSDEALCSNQCHHRNPDVTVIHSACTTCHTALDTSSLGTACTTCHLVQGDDYHPYFDTAHERPADSSTQYCVRCHTEQTDVRVIHSTNECATCHTGNCSDCHVQHASSKYETRGPLILTTKCQNCHMVEGDTYHGSAATAHLYADGESCVAAGCHASQSLPEAHDPYMDRFVAYEDSCALCHLNDDPNRIDWVTASADCASCHTVHGDLDAVHATTASQECVDCHETADVRSIHATDTVDPATSCSRCHDGGALPASTECIECHASESPPDPAHYDAAAHAALEDAGCADCHYLEMNPEHDKPSSGPTDCVTCHENAVDGFTAPWDGTCMSCHAVRHSEQAAKHVSTTTGCDGSECHDVTTDVSAVHAGLADGGCSACHTGPASVPQTTDCGFCHDPNHPDADAKHTASWSSSVDHCGTCHGTPTGGTLEITRIHAGVSGPCSVCHDNSARVPDITAESAECSSCHAVDEVDYHRNMVVHESADAALCSGQCHHAGSDVRTVHPSCTTCHTVLDTESLDTACTTCHMVAGADYHSQIETQHVRPVDADTAFCIRCHSDQTDVRLIHGTDPASSCATCHSPTVDCDDCHPDFPANEETYGTTKPVRTTKCQNCHGKSYNPEYHSGNDATHRYAGAPSTCGQSYCHGTTYLADAHEPYMSRYPQYEDTCALCHLNDDPDRIDWTTATADCNSCHAVHPTQDADHLAPDSQECVDCHETNSVVDVHKTNASELSACPRCHDNPALPVLPATTQCIACHAPGYSPPESAHYDPASHGAYGPGLNGCDDCHYFELNAEHAKVSSGPISCVDCHELKVDGFVNNWDHSCLACHTTQHEAVDPAHVSTTTACAGSGCHDISDVRALHERDDYVATQTVGWDWVYAFNEGFEVGDLRNWDEHGPTWSASNSGASYTGNYMGRATGEAVYYAPPTNTYLVKYLDLSDLYDIEFSFYYRWQYCDSDDEFEVQYFDGTWNTLFSPASIGNNIWFTKSDTYALPSSATAIRFRFMANSGDNLLLDDILVRGKRDGMANPSGNGCDRCHGPDALPTSTDCWDCHDGSTHNQVPQHKATTPESLGCGRCHESGPTEIDVTYYGLHGDQGWPVMCNTCHENPARVPDITLETAECASCHAITGTEYHRAADAAHTYADGASCVAAGCHASQSLPEVHDPYMDRFPAYEDSCALCHLSDDPNRIDWVTASADCASCHTVHGDLDVVHTTTASQECVDCHETADVRSIHATDTVDPATSCSRCHDGGALPASTECIECHASESPADPEHYSGAEAAHTATPASNGCDNCHYLELGPEHAKASAGPVSCVTCHETEVDSFVGPWDRTCEACHGARHGQQGALHDSGRAVECGDAGCHPTSDVADVHDGTPTDTGTGEGPTEMPFEDGFESGDLVGWSSAASWSVRSDQRHGGTYAARMSSLSPCTLEASFDASSYTNLTLTFWLRGTSTSESSDWVRVFATDDGSTWTQVWEKTLEDRATGWVEHAVAIPDSYATADFGFRIQADVSASDEYQYVDDVAVTGQAPAPPVPAGNTGCETCHSPAASPVSADCLSAGCHPGLAGGHHVMHDSTGANPDGCDACHFMYLDDEHLALDLACGTCHDSSAQTVSDAIASGSRNCSACHPDNHYETQQRYYEFNPNNLSGHRVAPDLPGMRDAFVVDGATYSWSIPPTGSFLRAGWDVDSIVTCGDCHTYSGASGPHGAAMQVNVDPDYPVAWSDGMLTNTNDVGMQQDLLCAKCHDLIEQSGSGWSNEAHKEHDDRGWTEGSRCVSCHISVPHGWARPRMLGSTTDPAPYTVAANGLYRFELRSYTPGQWDKRDCEAACDDHHNEPVSNPWPGTVAPPPDYGTVAGRVTDETGTGLAGATVSVAGGGSTLTGAAGYYTLVDVLVGARSVTAAKAGYTPQTSPATVVKDQTTTVDFTLAIAPVTTGVITGAVTDADSGAPVAGAVVSAGGRSSTTDVSGTYALTGIEEGLHTLSVSAAGYDDWTGSVTVVAGETLVRDVALNPTQAEVNLALGRNFRASRYEDDQHDPSKAGDGSTSTFWWSDNRGDRDDTEWLKVNLGSVNRVRRVEIVWAGQYYAERYAVYVTEDGRRWYRMREEEHGDGGTDVINFSARDVKQVRVYCWRTNDEHEWGYGIAELRVFEKAAY